MRNTIAIIMLAFVLVSCANPINQVTYRNYMVAGDQAAMRGDFKLAKRNYYRALVNTRIGNLGPRAEMIALFRYARILGNLCEHDEAEEGFIVANKINEKINGIGSAETYITALEIGQFNYDIGRYKKAAIHFTRAITIADKHGLGEKNPGGTSQIYADYADVLKKTGNRSKAKLYLKKSAELKVKAGDSMPEYTRYPKKCKQ